MKPRSEKSVRSGRKAKRKGSKAELWIAHALEKATGVTFQRTPASGGSQLKIGWKLSGDVVTDDKVWHFCVESKNQEGWRLEQIFTDSCIVWKWWKQTCDESAEVHMTPLLVFKRNFVDALTLVRVQDVPRSLVEDCGAIIIEHDHMPLALMTFDRFLKYVGEHRALFVEEKT